MAATIKSKVIQVLGTDSSILDDINAPEEVFTEALWSIASALPKRLLMSWVYGTQPVDPENMGPAESEAVGTIDLYDDIVLLCLRVKAVHTVVDGVITEEKYIKRKCKEINFENSFQALDSDSIYFATDYSPVYFLEPKLDTNKLTLSTAPATTGHTTTEEDETLPNNKSGIRVWKYGRQNFTEATWATATAFLKMPSEAEPVCVRAIALRCLDELLADASIVEEDSEVMQLLAQQKQLLDQEIKSMLDQLKAEWEN